MKLSENFWLSEFTHSQTATRLEINNTPEEWQIVNLKNLCKYVLQPLREAYSKPIRINSGYRSVPLNTAIGGSSTSQHCKGMAVDIDTVSDNVFLFHYIKNKLDFDQLIWEYGTENTPDWVHVSFALPSQNRKQVLRCYKDNGKTVYVNWE